MIDLAHVEALAAFAEAGTMTRAAVRLRLTQSAVSKRIAALEAEVGRALVRREGRRATLTSEGSALLERVGPLLAQIRDAVERESPEAAESLTVGISESVLASWGARSLARVRAAAPGLEVRVHAHRSPVAIEHVRSGEYAAGIVAGLSDAAPDLVCETLLEEEMVLVPSDLDAAALLLRCLTVGSSRGAKIRSVAGQGPALRGTVPVLAIESSAATARAVSRRLPALRRTAGVDLVVAAEVESFACLVAMAREGLGHALVPAGIARAMGVGDGETVRLPPPGLSRPVSFVARKSALARPGVAAFREALVAALPRGRGYGRPA